MGMDLVLSIVVLAAIVLLFGAWFLWRRGGPTKQIGLMVLLAMVMIANVLIWTIPSTGGPASIDSAAGP